MRSQNRVPLSMAVNFVRSPPWLCPITTMRGAPGLCPRDRVPAPWPSAPLAADQPSRQSGCRCRRERSRSGIVGGCADPPRARSPAPPSARGSKPSRAPAPLGSYRGWYGCSMNRPVLGPVARHAVVRRCRSEKGGNLHRVERALIELSRRGLRSGRIPEAAPVRPP